MKPIDAIKLVTVKQPVNNYSDKLTNKEHPVGTLCRRLLNDDEIQNLVDGKVTVEKRRATDPLFSFEIYKVIKVITNPGRLTLHKIQSVDYEGKGSQAPYPHLFTYWQLQPV